MFAQTSSAVAALPALPANEGVSLDLHAISNFPETEIAQAEMDSAQRIADWVRAYLVQPHPQLGRGGAVCPYASLASRADLIRIGSSASRDENAIFDEMRQAISVFEAIDCPEGLRHLRAVVVGFPNCGDDAGRLRLKRVQNRLRSESTRRGKMIGLFEPNSEDSGLVNPDFRPMRSPLPMLAIRGLVESDAPFVLRNPRLAPIYLLKFRLGGARRVLGLLWR